MKSKKEILRREIKNYKRKEQIEMWQIPRMICENLILQTIKYYTGKLKKT